MTRPLVKGVTEEEVAEIEATGWIESACRLNGKDGKPIHIAGFANLPLCMYPSEGEWRVATEDYVIARLVGPVTVCAATADRIRRLANWAEVNEGAKRGEPTPPGLAEAVERAIKQQALCGAELL